MKRLLSKKILLVLVLLAAGWGLYAWLSPGPRVDFNTQVKPILNKKCITCHGGVRRKADFSLLFRTEALAPAKSGKRAIIPGDPDHSELIRRITEKDPEERMPYRQEALSPEEISILRRWIKEGAPWGDHWAYTPVRPVPVPDPGNGGGWVRNDIDRFILARLREHGLQPSPQADKRTLLRRASFDLTGLPAPKSLADQFLQDPSDQAYGRLLDSLLASPRFGEKWASLWLDLARYADTKGYERDDSRSIWRYRDWVIRSFNADKPYDRFLTEQIAGDLLPGATDEQLIATAFHRNTMTNDEGGTDNEEFRTAAVIDRVNTTWEALLGTTFACVQCHSHPYDPFRHEEYYRFMAFFNDTRDEDTQADYPLLRAYPDSAARRLDSVLAWVRRASDPDRERELRDLLKTWQPAYNSLTCDQFVNSELSDTKWLAFRNRAVCRLRQVDLDQRTELIFRYAGYVPEGTWSIHLDRPDGPVLATIPLPRTRNGWEIARHALAPAAGLHDLYFTYSSPYLKKPEDNGALFDWFYFGREFPGKGRPGYAAAERSFWDLLRMEVPTTPVMMDNPPYMHRKTYVFERGNWLVKGDPVEPDVPQSLNPLPAGAPRNRLGLAMWLVSPQNPLTSRTIVNRLWEQLFGSGLAETLEDLGTQGIPPTHPELIDWLSWRLMHEDHWSLKQLLREIMLSATYRQDSRVSPAQLQADPANKWYGRGPRVRLSAEEIRDQALAVSGLLSDKMYGPSVFPYQPRGIWLSPWNGAEWKKSEGEDQYRRAVYTYWKRTAPYPGMLTFDGAPREVCTARRIRTNTPLQALTTLNDSAYMEAARRLAWRIRQDVAASPARQISLLFEEALGRPIDPGSLAILEKLYATALADYRARPGNAVRMAGGRGEEAAAGAALAVVANAVFNLDEFITKN
ncbi:MAG TPA: DUF1553 domain-containing protein [Chitinophagaceae bacterium]|nr:DUF1553 domain-containing protein [Chitinophagaceae bacterium]